VTTAHPSTMPEAVIIHRTVLMKALPQLTRPPYLPMLVLEDGANELTVSPGPSLGHSGGVRSRANGGWRCVGQTRSRRYRRTGRSR
jgi:hypothetical protein